METSVRGLQDAGVQATAKHWIGNEQEIMRNPVFNPNGTLTDVDFEAISANIDDRTMHEVYMFPFANSVKAGVAAMMCSYQRLNGSYACQNSKSTNGLLKGELGFEGYVMSDWGAVHSGVASIEAGLDMNMVSLGPISDHGKSMYIFAAYTDFPPCSREASEHTVSLSVKVPAPSSVATSPEESTMELSRRAGLTI